MASLGVDFGATKTLLVLLKKDFEDVKRIDTNLFLNDPSIILDDYLEGEEIEETLIATAGPLDREKGVIYPPNLPQEKIAIAEPFEDFSPEITLLNDCHAGALGEYVHRDVDDLIYLTLSTGIGAGVIADGRLIQGWNGNFAEVGHMKLSEKWRCGCGAVGHWEAICSGKNLPTVAESLTGKKFSSAEDIFAAYRDGDGDVEEVIREVQHFNAVGISNLINLYNPELVSIGGAMGLEQYDILIEENLEKIKRNVLVQMPDIERCSMGEEIILHGLKALHENDHDIAPSSDNP